jgi:hypothetical protein
VFEAFSSPAPGPAAIRVERPEHSLPQQLARVMLPVKSFW